VQDFSDPVRVTSGDEFQMLAVDFNAMATRLRQQFAELATVNDGLREQIAERALAERSLRETEAQLQHAQKMDAVGTLAGGVAHDFNNLLSVILGYSELALDALDQDAPIRPDLEQVIQAGNRATSLTRQLLAFSRKQVLQPEVLDLNELIGSIDKMLGRLIGAQVEIVTHQGMDEALVYADRGQLDQVLMNLAVNARDAMPDGGTLTVATAAALLDAAEATRLGTLPGAYTVLSVQDTGTGMDEATRARIFEPFFTTKASGHGTGLGLSTVYGIVRQSGGVIALESVPGAGTTFRIYFPAVEARSAGETAPVVRAAEGSGTETILLVEDEEQVRHLTRRMLEEKGYTVLTAGDGEAALTLAQQHQGPIQLLLTDVVMPRMGGQRLASSLHPRRPEMRVLFMSGYSEASTLGEDSRGQPIELLQKPFSPGLLTQRVRQVLDADGEFMPDLPLTELEGSAT
jgi:signal transduction histidine kinase/CheY-like chemotaxis protein